MILHSPSPATTRRDRRKTRRPRAWQAALLTGALAVSAVAPVFGGAPVAVAASVSGVVNTYQAVSAVSGTTVTVTGATRGASSSFAVGDRVMLIQMTGVSPAHAGSNMGNYDTATITAVSGASITLSAITRTYSPNTEAVQLVRMEHDTAPTTVTGTITAEPWDGATGGVVAMSGGSLVLNADVDASETGFTNEHAPTGDVASSLSSGLGSTTGRGEDGGLDMFNFPASIAGGGGGGIGGGGGTTGPEMLGTGAGRGGGGASGELDSSAPNWRDWFVVDGPPAAGNDGGTAGGGYFEFGGADGAAGGGGGVIGGGGGGESAASGAGGGTDGGGAGGDMRSTASGEVRAVAVGGGGGGPLGVGNGGDGLLGAPTGTSPDFSVDEGSAGGGGGSYGGGGGAASNFAGGDDSAGGGGGGSWTGGGAGGTGGVLDSESAPYPDGGDGNAAVGAPLPDSAHFLNLANPRLMMGGAGGRGSQDSGHSAGGTGGGIVFLDFVSIGGSGDARSDGGDGAAPAGGGAHSGAGGGAGGQMRVRAQILQNPLTFAANGGVGGTPTANLYHAGVSGGGGGAGGVWLELPEVEATCPAPATAEYSFELAGGDAGASIVNTKNGRPSGRGGEGGSGLGCVSPLQEPFLEFAKSSDPAPGAAVFPGDEIEYTVTIENTGAVASTDGLVTDDMSEVLDKAAMVSEPVVSCAPSGNSCGEVVYTSGDTTFEWRSTTATPMDVDTVATVTYTVEVDEDATGTVGNLLVEPDVVVEHPIIESGKTIDVGDGTLVDPGDTVEYTITVMNTGAVDSEEFSVFDDLSDVVDDATFDVDSISIDPAGLGTAEYDAATERLTWTGALAEGQSVDVSYSVTVNDDATGELRNAFLDTTVVNPVSGALQWNKVDDTDAANPLAGSEWELTPLDSEGEPAGDAIVIVDCVEEPCSATDTDPEPGELLVTGLEPGDYELVETKAPFGFVLDAAPITVTVLDTTAVTVLDDIVNEQQNAPSLPFTGGLGTEQLMILGGALLALMTGLGAWQAIRRRRVV